ncbi:unnamed protein product [Urochloa decumbens]|uniref:F-box/LRR-repeat protein 15/At3g58940/PEG3-like LRR domain-containing protein n=1 Tax=Urochloa decumbens TaxID=240449 RepID=A0ABC9GJE9_9POAL
MSNKHRRTTALEASTCDVISSLPDELLHHIPSFTTAWEAVQTCVLSMRWLHVWQPLRRLSIEGHKFTSKIGFMEFMDNLLLRRGCIPLDSFRWTTTGSIYLNDDRASLCVSYALCCSVRELEIVEHHHLLNLDHSYFTSAHLRILNLSGVSITDIFIERLFSGCPALEDLVMVDCHVLATKFSSTTLKNLNTTSRSLNVYDYDDDFEDLVIDAPNLISLHLEDLPFLAPCLVNVSSLVTAYISLEEESSNFDAKYSIVGALSNATKLKLLSPVDNCDDYPSLLNKVLNRDLQRSQTFNNLKKLSVGDSLAWMLTNHTKTYPPSWIGKDWSFS